MPWSEILSGGAGALAIAICWMFLKHLKDIREADLEEGRRKDESVERITTEFSQTVRQVSTDVKQGLDKLQETQSILLKDHRDQVMQLHDLLRNTSER